MDPSTDNEGLNSIDIEQLEKEFPQVTDPQKLANTHLPFPRPIIEGLLCQNEKGELAGGSKSFKTWTLIHQGLSVAAGIDWWGFPTQKTNVLFLNLEIPAPFFEERIRAVACALTIEIPRRFFVWHLRGAKLGDPLRWAQFLVVLKAKCKQIPNPLVVSDPIYKLLGGRNENSAGDVALLLEQLDDMIEAVSGGNFFGHHFSKGNQAAKEAIDRASGSGVFQRDPDSILTMTPHEKEGSFTVDAVLRNHNPIEPFVVTWNFPLFQLEGHLDPMALKQPGRPPKFFASQLYDWLGGDCLKTNEFAKRLRQETGMGNTRFYELLKEASAQELIIFDNCAKTWERNGTSLR